MIGLFFEQSKGWPVGVIGPVYAALLQVFAQRFDGTQELALFHGEGADGEFDGRSFCEQQKGFQ